MSVIYYHMLLFGAVLSAKSTVFVTSIVRRTDLRKRLCLVSLSQIKEFQFNLFIDA